MSDVYKFLLESQPAPNQANQAKTHSFFYLKPKPAAVNTDSKLESELIDNM